MTIRSCRYPIIAAMLSLSGSAGALAQGTYELRGGSWWTGSAFEPGTMYVADGRFLAERPEVIDSVVDLSGMWMVPPYAEGHTHTPAYVRGRVAEFERMGVFYLMLMNVHASTWSQNDTWFDGPVEANATVAGFTAPDGHPVQIGLRGGRTVGDLDGDWITAVDTEDDVARKFPRTAAANRDFIKAFLLYSDRYAERRGNPSIPARFRGMDPTLLPGLVGRAHGAGLRVAVHVRTRADFATAVASGADIIAHLPGFSMGPGSLDGISDPDRRADVEHPEWFRLTPADAAAAAASGVTVITTIGRVGGTIPPELDDEARDLLERLRRERTALLARNLTLLKEAGVTMAVGSDAGEGSPIEETAALRELAVFDDSELLRLLVEDTPRLIFPGRRIGRFEPDFEASFLALAGNPLRDWSALSAVEFRFKGRPLH